MRSASFAWGCGRKEAWEGRKNASEPSDGTATTKLGSPQDFPALCRKKSRRASVLQRFAASYLVTNIFIHAVRPFTII